MTTMHPVQGNRRTLEYTTFAIVVNTSPKKTAVVAHLSEHIQCECKSKEEMRERGRGV